MRFKIEVALALGFGGLALTGFVLPTLGYLFLALAGVVTLDIGRQVASRYVVLQAPLRFTASNDRLQAQIHTWLFNGGHHIRNDPQVNAMSMLYD